ncbi:hypothetical protein P3T37_000919 [Kitasatospora sp. MAA4]|uniref:recombinase family protein n=1 Tax=Kitasatospora sp. MAA4 TaxID=3035093 RepID=UPI002477218D|nr:recombinase family protein [Kitasatospora sp. MAA4]MDH6131550.1 hypothetical protein [Kitasatospora sp. MAA4]
MSADLVPAAYLRIFPQNSGAVEHQSEAMRRFAARLGVPAPTFYIDNGYPSTGSRPAFERLARAVLEGSHRLVMVPGQWVFSADDARAGLAIRMLSAAGCRRIVQLPSAATKRAPATPAAKRWERSKEAGADGRAGPAGVRKRGPAGGLEALLDRLEIPVAGPDPVGHDVVRATAEEETVEVDPVNGGYADSAMYLRCFPYDATQLVFHRAALRLYARQLGVAEPAVFMDNGCPSRGPRPALDRLIRLAALGSFRTVLVPGPFVFSLDDQEARFVTRQLGVVGCQVLELPPAAKW